MNRPQLRHGPPQYWFRDTTGVKVKIDSVGQFENGKHDDKYACLIRSTSYDEVELKLLDTDERIILPGAFISPVHPGDTAFDRSQRAMVLDGEYKGELAQLLSNDDEEWMVKFFPSGNSAVLSAFSMVQHVR